MTGTPTRVAVQVGAATVRVAGAEADGEPWLIAELPGPGPGVAALLADLVEPVPDELLLVHPACWPAARVAAWARDAAGLAGRVRAVPAPVAAAGWRAAAVLDVGHAGAEATRVAADGSVLTCRTCPVGGSRLDEELLVMLGLRAEVADTRVEAQRVREALSLLPTADARWPGAETSVRVAAGELRAALVGPLGAAVDVLREVLARDGPAPVLLVGGVARAPLLAELVDGVGIIGAVVAPRPDAAAVLGALALPRPAGGPRAPGGPTPAAPRLPPPAPRGRHPVRAALLTVAAAGLVAALLAVGAVFSPSPTAVAVPAGVLVQYGYRIDVPDGWEHTGGLPQRRRILLTPAGAPDGSDLVAVERTPLGYDSGAEPERARAELRAEFDAAVAGGSPLSGYEPSARLAGREVTAYRQQDSAASVVEWFVVLDGDAQLSVGCRHTPSGTDAVWAACAVVVGSVRRE